MDLAVIPFIFAGLGAAFISAMGTIAIGYDSRPKDFHALLHYASWLMFFPAFLIALFQRRWASLPLWLCFAALIGPGLTHPKAMMEQSNLNGLLELATVVILTEVARLIRGTETEKHR